MTRHRMLRGYALADFLPLLLDLLENRSFTGSDIYRPTIRSLRFRSTSSQPGENLLSSAERVGFCSRLVSSSLR